MSTGPNHDEPWSRSDNESIVPKTSSTVPLHFIVFKQVSSHIAHEANVLTAARSLTTCRLFRARLQKVE